MQKKRPWPSTVVAGAALVAAASATAAGLSANGPPAVLGQQLDFSVQVRLDSGETLSPECVSAEVTIGDRRLPPAAIHTVLEATGVESARIRVRTAPTVDEPVVNVLVNAGCGSRVSRRFVVLADPPLLPAAPVAAPVATVAPVALPVVAALPPEAVLPAAGGAPGGGDERPLRLAQADTTGALQPATPRGLAPRDDTTKTTPGDAAAAAARAAARAERRAAARATAAAAAKTRAAQRTAAARSPAAPVAPAAPRLKLEPEEPPPSAQSLAIEQALEAVTQAASAARASASAAAAASQRIASLEKTVADLRGEAKASRDLATQLGAKLSRAEDSGGRWTLPLLGAVLLLTALAAWLARRLNSSQRARERTWQAAVQAAPPAEPAASRHPTSPTPFVTSQLQQPDTAPARQRNNAPAWPPAAPADGSQASPPPSYDPPTQPGTERRPDYPYEAAMQRTEVLPARAAQPDEGTPRDVSIEELIDLEQQAEFFVVLGQDDAAVELLQEHLRHTGGSSPLPYLKLLEIHRRCGSREEYERLRTRFNQRFNAYAPEWEVDLQAGRTLETYAGVLPRLQQAWPRPLDAMAELEALLFRKSRGDLFELPAYREVLLLYSLARDLLDREAADTGNVDLLLPMADGGEFSSTAPAPFLGLEREQSGVKADFEDQPTAPVDFDLTSSPDRPTSIFDTLADAPEPPRRR